MRTDSGRSARRRAGRATPRSSSRLFYVVCGMWYAQCRRIDALLHRAARGSGRMHRIGRAAVRAEGCVGMPGLAHLGLSRGLQTILLALREIDNKSVREVGHILLGSSAVILRKLSATFCFSQCLSSTLCPFGMEKSYVVTEYIQHGVP